MPLEASVFSRRLLDEVGRVIRNCVAIYCVSLKVKALSTECSAAAPLANRSKQRNCSAADSWTVAGSTFAFSATGLSLFHRAVPRKPNYTSYV